MDYLKLSDEERDALLNGIDEAQRRLDEYEGDTLTVEEARSLLRDCLSAPVYEVLRNHKAERMLN